MKRFLTLAFLLTDLMVPALNIHAQVPGMLPQPIDNILTAVDVADLIFSGSPVPAGTMFVPAGFLMQDVAQKRGNNDVLSDNYSGCLVNP